jgi:hypothetical protein
MYTDFEVIQAWEFPWSDCSIAMDQAINSMQRNGAEAGSITPGFECSDTRADAFFLPQFVRSGRLDGKSSLVKNWHGITRVNVIVFWA